MHEFSTASLPDDLPEPSAEAILFRVGIEAFVASRPKEESLRFLRHMAETLATEESLSNVLLMRPKTDAEAVNRARRQAIVTFRRFLPVWLAAIAEE